MSDIDYSNVPTPPCPVCGSPTRLKTHHKNSKLNTDTRVFKCTVCGVEYPTLVPSAAPGQSRSRA